MHTKIALLFLLLSGGLFAQKEIESYYIQQTAAPRQEQLALEGFAGKMADGRAALQRGDCQSAVQFFREAEKYPEASEANNKRELASLIAQCPSNAFDSETPADAAATSNRVKAAPQTIQPAHNADRKYRPGRQFLLYDDPNCFEVTRQEAERAFRQRCWNDAAALFRASKNCTDADQNDRIAVNKRIEDCRLESEKELREKEQETFRQARHALAATRATQARELLSTGNRSLAYRLAEFANNYIAPEDNDACLQVMLDAAYYMPSNLPVGNAQYKPRIPFCYQLGENLGLDLQVRFSGHEAQEKIYAFSRLRRLLFTWEAATLKPETPVVLADTTLQWFDVLPDGRTLLFYSDDAFLFWRSPRQSVRLPMRQVSQYCFSPDGRTLIYHDRQDGRLYALSLSSMFAASKGGPSRPAPVPFTSALSDNLLTLAYGGPGSQNTLYAGFRDSIVQYQVAGETAEVLRTLRFHEAGVTFGDSEWSHLWLQPAAGTAVFANDTAAFVFSLPGTDSARLVLKTTIPGHLLAISPDGRWISTYELDYLLPGTHLHTYRSEGKPAAFRATVRMGEGLAGIQEYFNPLGGCFSASGDLLAAATASGRLCVWPLRESFSRQLYKLPGDAHYPPVVFNSDGTALFTRHNDTLALRLTAAPDVVRQMIPLPADHPSYFCAGKNWVAYSPSYDTFLLSEGLGKRRWLIPARQGVNGEMIATFGSDDAYFACLGAKDSVVVYSTATGKAVAGRTFDHQIERLYFVPYSEELLVLMSRSESDGRNPSAVVKIWNPHAPPDLKPRTVRLPGYDANVLAFSTQNRLIALSDRSDIRVFEDGNLLDAAVQLRANGSELINALAFHPDGKLLAAGYTDGSVTIWDLGTGQARYSWKNPHPEDQTYTEPLLYLRFTSDGRQLLMLFQGKIFFRCDIDPALVGGGVQAEFRRLVSFYSSEVRDFELAPALDLPGNFKRLAESGDIPLIRSFFDYFYIEAQRNNNVEVVDHYCASATALYNQLDAGARRALRPILLEMLESYQWKLLTRNKISEAEAVLKRMQAEFDNPALALQAAAHTALLKNDLPRATHLYIEWALKTADRDDRDGSLMTNDLEDLHAKIQQLRDYDFLGPEQMACFCASFGSFEPMKKTCAAYTAAAAPIRDATLRLRWSVLLNLYAAQHGNYTYRQRTVLLEKALENLRQMSRRGESSLRKPMENMLLALADVYWNWGLIEDTSPRAIEFFEKAVGILRQYSPFQTPALEHNRKENLIQYQFFAGNAYLEAGQIEKARLALEQALPPGDTTGLEGNASTFAGLHERLGLAYLLEGRSAEALRILEAGDEATPYNRGHVALLEKKEGEALSWYRQMTNESSIGQAFFDIGRMAQYLPAQRARLSAFLAKARIELCKGESAPDSVSIRFFEALLHIRANAAREKWDSAFLWSMEALRCADRKAATAGVDDLWHDFRLDAVINQSYYFLFVAARDTARLTQQIDFLQKTTSDIRQSGRQFGNEKLLYMNLAHTFWLRRRPDDDVRVVEAYRSFLRWQFYSPLEGWELLLKDFRQLAGAVQVPDLQNLIERIKPAEVEMTSEDWRDLGVRK